MFGEVITPLFYFFTLGARQESYCSLPIIDSQAWPLSDVPIGSETCEEFGVAGSEEKNQNRGVHNGGEQLAPKIGINLVIDPDHPTTIMSQEAQLKSFSSVGPLQSNFAVSQQPYEIERQVSNRPVVTIADHSIKLVS
ncbi:unnamed protein product [Protopolystoma xenopodis]|uniref:Uncharacterized protein n=1 Tax=Protopolystoma xenopodis TaxID=117903 RepID=A0A3S5AXL5_9PLAT|nr:unnamed protein product [Protopolystoma xenopodis]